MFRSSRMLSIVYVILVLSVEVTRIEILEQNQKDSQIYALFMFCAVLRIPKPYEFVYGDLRVQKREKEEEERTSISRNYSFLEKEVKGRCVRIKSMKYCY